MANVLVVDDSTMVRKYHQYYLSGLGHQVAEAEDGYVALEMLLSNHYDLILTDINMPRMDGYQFIAEVRQVPRYQNTPIIIVTSQEDVQDADQGKAVGANLIFIKPTELEKLIDWISRLLEGVEPKEG
ncbi:response regulator [Desulfosporosinus hippei]|uniref:Stage 0 sporulation protein A homolog n=1 Tax=Desulfosporosinus hippei DSM 8344 TaxID=1121419 RepID=A0A1G7WBY6_9FIRM|nr:response regulator [Desulfosporosinus hippei]SDG69462.1 two-component system, chemotaxis family, response regulator CheY [Desulfosporosinus hippei DSM 8344]